MQGTLAAGAGAIALSAFGGFTNLGFTPVQPAAAGPLTSDLNILNYALTLEYLEAAAYRAINSSGLLSGRAKTYFDAFGAHEQTHVDTLVSTIQSVGGTPVTPPAQGYNFSSVPNTAAGVLAFFKFVEDVGASAYLGAAAAIQNDDILEAALSIHAVEAEHAAALADIVAPGETGATSGSFTPDGAFARFRTPDQVFQIVAPFYTPQTSPFSDVSVATPYSTAIFYLAGLGIVRGQDGQFQPNSPLLRAQMAGLIARAFLWADEMYGTPFQDQGSVDNDLWNSVGILSYYNVARGYNPTEFDPATAVLHAQVVSFVTRAMITKGFWTPAQTSPMDQYPNVTWESGHRLDIATYVNNVGPVPGTTDTKANWVVADREASRAFSAEVVYQALRSIDTTPKVIVPTM
jgi:predicted lactoylglutathione lyase